MVFQAIQLCQTNELITVLLQSSNQALVIQTTRSGQCQNIVHVSGVDYSTFFLYKSEILPFSDQFVCMSGARESKNGEKIVGNLQLQLQLSVFC